MPNQVNIEVHLGGPAMDTVVFLFSWPPGRRFVR